MSGQHGGSASWQPNPILPRACGIMAAVPLIVATACSNADGDANPLSAVGGAATGSAPGVGAFTGSGSGGGGCALVADDDPSDDDLFTIQTSMSPQVATVGIVQWSISVPIDQAYVEFGHESGAYEYCAPVEDPTAATHRTLLLGMKPNHTYYARIVAGSGANAYGSEEVVLQTGFLPNALPALEVRDVNAAALYGGFTITCTGFANAAAAIRPGGGGVPEPTFVFIFDRDGDMVWAYELSETAVATCSSARFSSDGRHLWVGNFSNVSDDGALMRLALDGTERQEFSFPGRHHHFAMLPNNHVLLYEQANGGGYDEGYSGVGEPAQGAGEGPDIIREFDPQTGAVTDLYHEDADFEQQIDESGAHTNYVTYVPYLHAISLSMRHTSTIALISYPAGELLATFGGPSQVNTFGITWDVQHGHHLFDDRILIFNNNGSGGSSDVLEYQYDLATRTATLVSTYRGGVTSAAFGDVQRLPNGNTFVTYSTAGACQEIDASGALLREITATDPIGYAVHRKSLYGLPPPFD